MTRITAAPRSRLHVASAESLEPRRLLSAAVLTWHNDAARTGLNASETQLTPANVNSGSFAKLFAYPVDGQVYAQPLYVPGVTIPGRGVHDVIVVATETDKVYALDADSPVGSGGVLWQVSLGTPAPLPNPYIYPPGGRYGPNITPVVGITGTPVIDPATNTIYVDAFTNDAVGVFAHRIHALDLATGADKITPALVAATTPGNSVGGDGSVVTFDATHHLQRPALALVNGTVYVSYGSYSDTDPYHGWVLGFDAATLQLRGAFNSTPNLLTPAGSNPGEGAFWQSGAGPASDGSNLFVMSGNGDFDASLGDYGDSFIKLSPAGSALSASDYFAPSNQQQLSDQDQDLGSGGPMVLPDSVGSAAHPHLLVGCGKQGLIYLIDRDNLGGFHSTADHVVQEVSLGSGTWSSPAYFNGRIYYHGSGDVLKAFSIQNGVLSTTPVAQSTVGYGYPGASPVISADGTANGIVWDLQSSGVLHAYDATTLRELYNSGQAGSRDQLGSYENFTSPSVADGKVFVGTGNSVAIFGLLPAPTAPPAAPTALTATQLSSQAIVLTWTNNAADVTGFQVQRSTDGANFVNVATASAVGLGGTASYVDSISTGTGPTLYYRVIATNLFNGGSVSDPSNVAAVTVSTPVQVFQDTYATNTAGGYTESTEPGMDLQDGWTVANGRLNYSVTATNGWASSVFLLNPAVASTAGLSRFAVSGDLIGPRTYQAGLVVSGDTTSGGFVVQEFDNGAYNNHLVLLRETGGQLLADEGGVGNPPVLADFGDISQHNGDTFHVTAAADRSGPHPVLAVSITDLTSPSFTLTPQTVTDTGDPANYGGTQIGWRARWMAAPASFGVDNLTLATPPPPADEIITGSVGIDTITLKRDGANIDWTLNSGGMIAKTGQLPVTDPNGLTINGGGGSDALVLDAAGGNPLPNLLKLNGSFSTTGAPPLAAGQTIDLGTGSLLIHYTGTSSLAQVRSAIASGADGGKWDGTGIVSSAARTNPALAVAFNDSADPLNADQPADTVLLHVALRGDSNSDGRVDFGDLLTLAQHYGQTGADWAMGDFDYNGSVGFADLLALAQNYGAPAIRRRTNTLTRPYGQGTRTSSATYGRLNRSGHASFR